MSDRSLEALRAQVLKSALTLTAIAAPLLAAMVLVQAVSESRVNAIVVALIGFVLLFPLLRLVSRWLAGSVTGLLYLLLMLCMSTWVQLRGGVASPSAALQLIIVVLSGLLYGGRGALLGLVATLGSFAFAGWVVTSGHVPPVVATMWDPMRPEVWIRGGTVLAFYGGAAALAVVYTLGRLDAEAGLLRDALAHAQSERSAREQAEQEQRRARATVAEAQRVEGIARLASGVAHDYNNSLTVILAAAEAARMSPEISEEVRGCLDDITAASSQAAEVTRSLLALGRRDLSDPIEIELAPALDAFAGALRRLLPPQIDLRIADDCQGRLYLDRTQLERSLLNLVINARDAIDGAGTIEIGSRVELLDHGEHDLSAGRYATLWVRDSGRGMDDDVKQNIFEPFYTTKEAGQGTGIGMALVRGFALDQHGAVHVDSAPGQGTTITLYLPHHDPRPARPGPPADPQGALTASGL